MKRVTWFLVLILFIIVTPLFAAPMFPDIQENHWARDAVADLAARGVIEGYPDGTFKGDRAATRWEMAMAIQRLLAKLDAEHSKFATKVDLEALRALANNLKDELGALGVRVGNLEENVGILDKRVTELERITFDGDFTTRFVGMGLQNTGITGTSWSNDVGGIEALSYINGYKIGTIDLLNGRPLLNGSSFTARARLGVKVKISKKLKAGVRFASYTSLGNRYIDAYWGVPAPYLSNVFCGNSYSSSQPMNNSIWTRMTLDKFWLEYMPGKTKLVVGSIEKTQMNDFLLRNVPNPGIDGKRMLDLSRMGMIKHDKDSSSQVEGAGEMPEMPDFMQMRRPPGDDSGRGFPPEGYPQMMKPDGKKSGEPQGRKHEMQAPPGKNPQSGQFMPPEGFDPSMMPPGGMPPGGMPLGAQQKPDMSYYSLPFYGIQASGEIKKFAGFSWETMYSKMPDSPYMMKLPWPFVNPPGVAEESIPYLFSATGGWKLKEHCDIRINFLRISDNFNNGQSSNVVLSKGNAWQWSDPYDYRNNNKNKMPMRENSYISLQGQTGWGLNINYRLNPANIKFNAAYAATRYKPNQESSYTADGTHYHMNVKWANKPDTVDLTLEYVYTDPFFDPFQLYYQPVGDMLQGGMVNATGFTPFPAPNYPLFGYQLHDSDKYPNNSHGFMLLGNYKFDRMKGIFHFHIGRKYQVDCSVPQRDIKDKYFGLQPGFIDTAFPVLASSTQTGAAAKIYETPRGHIDNFGCMFSYFFAPSRLRASLGFDAIQVMRDTSYALNTSVAKTNKVNMKFAAIKLGLEYHLSRKFQVKGGYNWIGQKGYNNGMNDFSANAGSNVVEIEQSVPYLGFDYKLNKDTNWSAEVRYYDTRDRLSSSVRRRSPESFQAIQVFSTFKVKL